MSRVCFYNPLTEEALGREDGGTVMDTFPFNKIADCHLLWRAPEPFSKEGSPTPAPKCRSQFYD